jgi:DNA-directed RNA polymerase specialized sigma24 family protein
MQGRSKPPEGLAEFFRLARTIVRRRIRNRSRAMKAAKRHAQAIADDHEPDRGQKGYVPDDLDLLACDLPAPEASVIVEDSYDRFMVLLRPELQMIVQGRLMGLTTAQIAAALEVSIRSVERMSQEIREIWSQAERGA